LESEAKSEKIRDLISHAQLLEQLLQRQVLGARAGPVQKLLHIGFGNPAT
jgi:hypothetical protein